MGAGGTRAAANGLDRTESLIAINESSEDDVLAIKKRSSGCTDKELGAVGVGASVGHGEATEAGVLSSLALEGLIGKRGTINGLTTSTISIREVPALAHKVVDDAMKHSTFVVKGLAGLSDALLASAEGAEVLSGLGDGIVVQLEDHAAGSLSTDGHIKEDAGSHFGCWTRE